MTGAPLVLHGGSGEDADFAAAIENGICIVHINTEIRRAFTDAVRAYLAKYPDEVAPYKYTTNASLAMEKAAKEKVDTKLESYKLHQQGKSVAEIAAFRNLTPDTIAGHLAHYVKNGQIAVKALLSKEIISLIEPFISDGADNQIAVIRNSLDNRVNFGDIRIVIAHAAYKKQHAVAGNTAEEPA